MNSYLRSKQLISQEYPYLQWHRKLLNIINNNNNQQSIKDNNRNALNQYNKEQQKSILQINEKQEESILQMNKKQDMTFMKDINISSQELQYQNRYQNQLPSVQQTYHHDIANQTIKHSHIKQNQQFHSQNKQSLQTLIKPVVQIKQFQKQDQDEKVEIRRDAQLLKDVGFKNEVDIQKASQTLNIKHEYKENEQVKNQDDEQTYGKEEQDVIFKQEEEEEEDVEEDEDNRFFQDDFCVRGSQEKQSLDKNLTKKTSNQNQLQIEFKTQNIETNETKQECVQSNLKTFPVESVKKESQNNNYQQQSQQMQQSTQQNEDFNESDCFSLGSKDDLPDQDQLETKNNIYGYYTKVYRTGTKWKVILKNLIAQIEDSEFIFQELQGEFHFINEH